MPVTPRLVLVKDRSTVASSPRGCERPVLCHDTDYSNVSNWAGRRLIRLSILAVRHRAGEDTRSVRQALKGARGGGREGRRRHCAFSGRGSLKVGVRARTAESFRGVSEIYPTYQPWARTHNATAHTVIRAAPRSGRPLRSRQRAASVSSPLHPTAGSPRSRQRPR